MEPKHRMCDLASLGFTSAENFDEFLILKDGVPKGIEVNLVADTYRVWGKTYKIGKSCGTVSYPNIVIDRTNIAHLNKLLTVVADARIAEEETGRDSRRNSRPSYQCSAESPNMAGHWYQNLD
jgi:hypothetical protein